jgi:L-iditol 2-dehydrogenase
MFQNGRGEGKSLPPLILGHELSGQIAAVGKGISAFREGMRVAAGPNVGCGVCDLCVSGNTHLCPDYVALGIHIDGGFAEYVRIPSGFVRQGNIVEIAEGVSFEEAALAEPLSCAYSGFERSRLRPGETVLVIGAGPIGIMHAKLARLGGASKVMINDLDAGRMAQCHRIDASFIMLGGLDLKEQVLDLTRGRGADVCITACASPAAQEASVELAAINGRVIFFGGLPKDESSVRIDTNRIHYRQLTVTGTTRASLAQYRRALELVSNRLVNLKDLISSVCSIQQCPQAIENASRGAGLKTVIRFGENE